MEATDHLALRPKSDLALCYGVAKLLVDRGWIDRAFIAARTTGFDAFAAHVAAFTLDRVARDTGLPASTIERLADHIHRARRA
jgi:anaerobic selenocysteine-containing dehydrogenase